MPKKEENQVLLLDSLNTPPKPYYSTGCFSIYWLMGQKKRKARFSCPFCAFQACAGISALSSQSKLK
nr:hypothetical protein [Tanacetum cinerariifolium]